MMRSFREYQPNERRNYITLSTGEYYPDIFFDLMQTKFPDMCIWGPKRSGADVQAIEVWADYPNNSRPLDFIISSPDKKTIYAVGLARYDGDRGGAQEDDRTGGYKNCSDEYSSKTR